MRPLATRRGRWLHVIRLKVVAALDPTLGRNASPCRECRHFMVVGKRSAPRGLHRDSVRDHLRVALVCAASFPCSRNRQRDP